ncbi:hypothetical protein FE257_011622 [Aspergillus nanangensis]|uniref:Heterokaryon incompatibility domain-containing protein n=1 Tax=Aspergillus nanangensis TaxID=2582783 RepID=A0AAD4CUY9_ASPNN|nr:hypothetical protein FE257_011622 [Aspergillus nanangensis]
MAVVSDRDKLCHQCAQIPPISEIVLQGCDVWDSLQQMQESAQNGCPSCTFFYRHCFKPGIDEPRDKDEMVGDPKDWGPYRLRWNGDFSWETTPVNAIQSIAIECDKNQTIETYEQGYKDVDEASYLLFADPYEPLAKTVGARDVSLDPCSDIVFERIKGWIAECCRKHTVCEYEETPVLPRFVVEIGPSEEISGEARPCLRLIENDGTLRAAYITLSFVWGVLVQPVQLSQSNIEDFKKSINYSLLPPTIRDFIYVAQRLEVKYIWIDTLCIIQDNEEVKKQQIAQMNMIFGKSFLTVQAGNVHSVHESFLRPRDPPKLPHLKLRFDQSSHIFLRANGPVPHPDASSPANRRGWIFEESVLPTRLLVYGTHQMIFACLRGNRHEDGFLEGPGNPCYPSFLRPKPWWAGGVAQMARRRYTDERLDFLKCWHTALSVTYTVRSFTLPQDKLRAIHGVVARLQEKIGGRFIAGLWEFDMPWGLLWSSCSHVISPAYLRELHPMTRTVGFNVPSWSWASVEGRTDIRFVERFRRSGDPVASIDTDSIQVDDMGEICRGVLKITGPFLYTELVHSGDELYEKLRSIASGMSLVTRGTLSRFSMIVWAKPPFGPGNQDARLLGIANIDVKEERLASAWCILISPNHGLMLECVDPCTMTFRRVGFFTLNKDDWLPSLNMELLTKISVV